ncbi:hypothetical protein PoB_007186200 [Plakobranchus ocellatus]|uniref:Uncharacterized protein n=1 Tax=Plakobranchus ocellatus TaxID=259542 RepID=A0AAV4DM82_9GAST|nr:hypothetical protein PoB_007186200 [Plakobranchus ocellatus]
MEIWSEASQSLEGVSWEPQLSTCQLARPGVGSSSILLSPHKSYQGSRRHGRAQGPQMRIVACLDPFNSQCPHCSKGAWSSNIAAQLEFIKQD